MERFVSPSCHSFCGAKGRGGEISGRGSVQMGTSKPSMAWPVLLALLFLAGQHAGLALTPGCDARRDTVLECLQQLLDLNHDGQITAVEVNVALNSVFTFVPDWLTWQYVMRCDFDGDGVLTRAEWEVDNPYNATCLPTQNCLDIACIVCARNGFVQSKRNAPGPGLAVIKDLPTTPGGKPGPVITPENRIAQMEQIRKAKEAQTKRDEASSCPSPPPK